MEGLFGYAFSGVWGYKVRWVRIAGALHWCPSDSYWVIFSAEQEYSASKMNTSKITADIIL